MQHASGSSSDESGAAALCTIFSPVTFYSFVLILARSRSRVLLLHALLNGGWQAFFLPSRARLFLRPTSDSPFLFFFLSSSVFELAVSFTSACAGRDLP